MWKLLFIGYLISKILEKQFFIGFWLFLLASISIYAQPNAPILKCANSVGGGDVEIVWQNQHNCGGNFVATYIYESVAENGPYSLLQTITSGSETSATVPNPANAVTYYYLVTECNDGESVSSDTLNTAGVLPPTITNVSVSGGASAISWNASPSPNAHGYLVYGTNAQGASQLIDTILVSELEDPNNPSYIDFFGTPDTEPEEYDLATIDSCGGTSTLTFNPHTTIFLRAEYDSCNSIINLIWTPYQGWGTDGVTQHEIARSIDPINFEEVESIGGSEFAYAYEIQPGDPSPLRLIVRALNQFGETSFSNVVEVDIELASLPDYVYMRNVSVVNENQIQVDWLIDPNGTADVININRGVTLDDINPIFEIDLNTPSPQVDSEVNTARDPYYYTVSASSGCGAAITSGLARTIFLNGQDNFDLSNGLTWNAFEMPNAIIQSYTLYRVSDGNLTELSSFGPNEQLTYIDDVSDVPPEVTEYCYIVQCEYDLDLPIDFETGLTSFSNTVCIAQTSRIFVPNAFAPNGVNNIFKPTIVYPVEEGYSMIVLNRWGEKIFETIDITEGWDGNINGGLAPQGVYPYIIKMMSSNGSPLERKGTVLLIR